MSPALTGGAPFFVFIVSLISVLGLPNVGAALCVVFAGCANGGWWNYEWFSIQLLVESPHRTSMADRIDNVHGKGTLLKTAKGCGTHLLSIASKEARPY